MKQKIYEMFEEKLVKINTAYNAMNSNLPNWQDAAKHDVELCKMGLAYFKSGVPTPEEVRLKQQFDPIDFAYSLQWFNMAPKDDVELEKDFELRLAVEKFYTQRHK